MFFEATSAAQKCAEKHDYFLACNRQQFFVIFNTSQSGVLLIFIFEFHTFLSNISFLVTIVSKYFNFVQLRGTHEVSSKWSKFGTIVY